MLPRDKFDAYRPPKDKYADDPAVLVLDDLKPKKNVKIGLSYFISTYNRQHQLSRSLETLARQEWKNFEVCLMDDGSTQDIKSIADTFDPYLHIQYFRVERGAWHSCPSRGFRYMFPHARGEIVALAHPEMMLAPKATYYLYYSHKKYEALDVKTFHLEEPVKKENVNEKTWVSLRPQFLLDEHYDYLNGVDWHSDISNLSVEIPNFKSICGFAARPNVWHSVHLGYPWWFVASCRKNDPILAEMPQIDGHGIIDMWFVAYRREHNYVDIIPDKALCYHQPHQTTAFAPEGEQDSEKVQIK